MTAPTYNTVRNPTLDQTLAVMRREASRQKKLLRPLAEQICKDLEPGDYNGEVFAIYCWVRQSIRYMRDIHDVEYVKAPMRLIENNPRVGWRQGDCDDVACLLAALCMAVGNECRFVVAGFEPNNPSHVFCQVCVRGGGRSLDGTPTGGKAWVTLDPVADEKTSEMHGRMQYAKVYGI